MNIWTNFKARLLWFYKICLILLLVVTIASYFSSFHMRFELLSHFKLQYLALSLLLFVVMLLFRQYKFSFIAIMVLCINAYDVVGIYKQPVAVKKVGEPTELKLVLSNVYTNNQKYQEVIDLVEAEKPDIFIALETNYTWLKKLSAIHNLYPYRIFEARSDNFGIGLFSKAPIYDPSIIYLSDANLPSIKVSFQLGGKPFTLIATHPLPPTSEGYYKDRNQQLIALASELNSIDTPKILIGDLNVTMWSHNYRQLESSTSMSNTRIGFGVIPTWPSELPVLAIPIDHCLVSSDFEVLSMFAGPNVGSDHLPLVIRLAL